MKNKICILDYGCGNTQSVSNSIKFLGYKPLISSSKEDIKNCSHLILPGVGSYTNALNKIRLNLNLKFLENEVVKNKKPLLGICVGMQVFSEYGYEFAKCKGLGWIRGSVKKMKTKPHILPQIGWNDIVINNKNHKLFYKINSKDFFYFVHSYRFHVTNKSNILASTIYNETFPSVISKGNIIGVQFHPEKSQSSGLKLLKNFIENFR